MKTVRWRKLHQDNRGSAMAMVLIIVAFIGILTSVLMFTAYGGYQMRAVDRQGTDNFYSAETVLDEINAGLQADVSAALSASYEKVMVNYALYETAEKRSQEFYRLYSDKLKNDLKSDTDENQYKIEKLRGYLRPEMCGDGTGADGSRGKFGNYGAIVESNVKDASGNELYTLAVEADGVVLKDLKVSYVNRSGYVSMITTDIRIVLPEVAFEQSSTFPDLSGYCLIADKTLAMGNTSAAGNITILGNAYAGQMSVGKIEIKKDDGTVEFARNDIVKSDVKFEKWTPPGETPDGTLGMVVCREGIEVGNRDKKLGSSLTTEQVELWGGNLDLYSSAALLDGKTNIQDDLVLDGDGSEAVLKGEYAGFAGFDNTREKAEASSAIIVNGKNSSLDLSALTSLNISGRSYVATAAKEGETNTLQQQNKADVVMGQSIAVKSDQLAYLVPPEALGCEYKTDKDGNRYVGESVYKCNPLTSEQYEEIVNHPDQYVLIDGNKSIAALGGKSLSSYMEEVTVEGSAEKRYVPERVYKVVDGKAFVYCYIRFENEKAANQYFADYYNVKKEQVDSFTKLYVNEIKLGNEADILYLAGNALRFSAEGTGTLESGRENVQVQKDKAKSISKTKSNIFTALSAKIVTNIAQLTAQELTRTAFDNIIDGARLDETIEKLSPGAGYVKIVTDSGKGIILSKGDYAVTDPSINMIITRGNVTVQKDFKGLIIAKGSIIVDDRDDADRKVTIKPVSLEDFTEMLNTKKEAGGAEYFVLEVFKDGVNYSSSSSTAVSAGTEKVAMSDLIVYEHWSKR